MIHIFLRHTSNTYKAPFRPEWFEYEKCFTNLLNTINEFQPLVKIYVVFDGEVTGSFITKYHNKFQLIQINGGNDKNSFFITCEIIKTKCENSEIKDGDLIYFLENDYLHVKNWIPKVLSFFKYSNDKYVSLYDHADKYSEGNILPNKIYVTDNSHWRSTPSTCGSFIISKNVFLEDYDISKKIFETCFSIGTTPDHFKFLILNLYKKREVVTPIPGLSTHVMNGLMSPIINWSETITDVNSDFSLCLYDHHDFPIPTDGIGGVIGSFQMMIEGFKRKNISLTVIVNDKSTIESEKNLNVIKLPFSKINDIRFGNEKISNYFNGDIFFSNSSGRHVNFDFTGFKGKWVSCCQGCLEFVGNSNYQVFVSNNQLKQHLNDNLFDSYANNYKVIHNAIDTSEYYWEEGKHDRIVWMGRIDGAKAERLYDIALVSKEKILAAGTYSPEWEWLFNKIISTNNVEWVGKVEGVKNKRKFYSNAKLSIHCSTFEDPCPLTVLEAQACGIPVVTYANGSLSEICYFKDYVTNSLESFTEKINSFQNNNYSIELMDYINTNFSKEKYIEKWFSFFKQIVKN